MRILHLISSLGVGGAETMLLKLVQEQTRRGHAFHVVSLTGDGPIGEGLRAAGAETAFLGMTRGVPDPLALGRLLQAVRRWSPDLLQSWMYHADLMGGLVGRVARVPVVWGIRGTGLDAVKTKRTTLLARRLCAGLSGILPRVIVSCSHAAVEEHVAVGYRRDRIRVIPNGFELAKFRPDGTARAAVRAELGLAPGQPLVGLMARFDPLKDYATFAAAVARLVRTRPDAAFLACGDGVTPENELLSSLLREAGAEGRVRLLGRRNDMPHIAAALDVATLSSCGEGFPNVIGEAMACGVPAVVTDVGDSRWLVGDTGRTVPPRDPEALAAGWAELLALDEPARRDLGRRARERVEREFDIRQVSLRFEELYREMVPGSGAGELPPR